MGRHSGDAYDAAPDEWRPVAGGDGGHSPLTRRHVLGILGVAGAAAACTAGVSVVANKPDSGNGSATDGALPKGAPAKPVGLAAGVAGITAPTSTQETAKAYDKTGYRSSVPPQVTPKALLQRPTILSLDPDLHWARRLTYGVSAPALQELRSMGRAAYLEKQLTVQPDPLIKQVGARYSLLQRTPTQLKQMYDAEQDKPDDQKHDYMATEDQLVEMKIIKSVWSTNQLFEKVHDVWSAYVHVPIGEKTRLLTADYDRTVVRRYAFGKFSDMLKAMIFHPAMLVYLDQPQSNGNAKREDGLPAINENLGRELLELFSVGALDPITRRPNYDGRLDVVQSAYALTGLTVDNDTLTMKFDPDMRFRGPLRVMTWKHPNTDPDQGVKVVESLISFLANHPATARSIATAFARHFVSDTPRPELIAKLAAEFTRARTDIKPMLRMLFASEDFRKSVGQKYRTGWEYIPASLRAVQAELNSGLQDAIAEKQGTFQGVRDLRYQVEQSGGGPHGRATPDGQPDFQAAWLSGKGMLDRWNQAGITAGGFWKGIKVPSATALASRPSTQAQMVANLQVRLVGQQLQPGFTAALHQSIGSAPTTPASQVQDPVTLVRSVLSVPHLNYT
ncbi:MAG TPA: DUF1800 family protein [Mycobacteriales bacterium]|jgi:uncharacterized protein (DUF1800 family)|nr:DUF1800 family protein [Mycobacteriales bacterium]